jgi:putative nucleotidyltransferase with HDIG domain
MTPEAKPPMPPMPMPPVPTTPSTLAPPTLSPLVRKKLEERITGGQLELPVLPEVASQVVTLSNDPNADMRKMASLVQRDQAMAGHLMRLANSPFYAPKTPLVSLDQVVSRMGMKKVREIALVISCQSKVFAVPGHEATVKKLFRHSLAAAAFAQEIARSRRWNVEEAFLCGLLHDVGRPVLLQELVDLHAEANLPFQADAAAELMSLRHAEVGSTLVNGWSLPARLGETILHHHFPSRSTTAAQTAMMTNLADDLAHLLLEDERTVTEAQIREHPMLTPLNLYPDEMEALLAKRPTVLGMIGSIA